MSNFEITPSFCIRCIPNNTASLKHMLNILRSVEQAQKKLFSPFSSSHSLGIPGRNPSPHFPLPSTALWAPGSPALPHSKVIPTAAGLKAQGPSSPTAWLVSPSAELRFGSGQCPLIQATFLKQNEEIAAFSLERRCSLEGSMQSLKTPCKPKLEPARLPKAAQPSHFFLWSHRPDHTLKLPIFFTVSFSAAFPPSYFISWCHHLTKGWWHSSKLPLSIQIK